MSNLFNLILDSIVENRKLQQVNTNYLFELLWEEYLLSLETVPSSANYRQRKSHGNTWLLPVLSGRKVYRISEDDWQDILNNAACAGLKKKTLENIKGTITNFVHFAYRKKAIPYKAKQLDLDVYNKAGKNRRKILQPYALNKLFTTDYIIKNGKKEFPHYLNVWRLIVITGFRRGEIAGIWEHEIEDTLIPINRAINEYDEITGGKNANAIRVIPQTIYSKKIIADQIQYKKNQNMESSEWLFPHINGQQPRPKSMYKTWKTYCKQHNIDCSLQELRHTFASLMKMDLPIEYLKMIMGHNWDMDTVGTYGHYITGEEEKIRIEMEKVLSRYIPI